jgi:hypothetical protein
MMSGVGNIPATTIDAGGRATTAPTYVPHVQSAAFTGILNVLGNNVTLNSLWSSGARKYRILHRLGAAGPFANFRQGWTNYHWTGATSVLESFGPDASDMYPLPNPADDYSIQKLLLQWNTLGAVNGIHQFPGGVLQSSKCARCLPSADSDTTDRQRCAGRSDRRPTLQGTRHRALRHVNITAPPAPVQIHIKAFDAPGDLYSYNVTAYYGMNQSVGLASVGYPGGNWQGTPDTWIDAPLTFPPQTCAYQFRLTAGKRVTDGYSYVGGWEADDHVTLFK